VLTSASRETATEFIIAAIDFPRKEQELVKRINAETLPSEKTRLTKELDNLVEEFRSTYFQTEISEQDKAKKPKISSRSKVTRKKVSTKKRVDSNLENEFIPEDGKQQHDEKSTSSNQFTYKRKTHFGETLRRAQGKAADQPLKWDIDVTTSNEKGVAEQTVDLLVTRIGREMEMSRIPAHMITPRRVRQKLKKLGGSRYFEFSTCVACRLNPTYKPLVLEPEHEAKLLEYFVLLEPVFDAIKTEVKSTRNNFMNYPNTAYKLCEMLGQDEENKAYLGYMKHFSPLKSEQLQVEQDEFWELCCEKLEMPFYRTIGNAIRTKKRRPKRKRVVDAQKRKMPKVQQFVPPGNFFMSSVK
jgi:hypothetical protein